ncbi:MAG TPA: flagellar filament capping protein FliD [Candidatus Binataceae bacterium]|nr:flagellar filament capping protein FliD [Candidatus Binataceae bacterium]
MAISLNSATLLSGNGIDINSMVAAVEAPQVAQIQLYQQQQSTLQTQAGLLTSINNDLNNLSTAVNSLTDVLGPLTAQTVSSSQPSIVTASAQTTAAAGNHTIVVNTLATQGTIYTQPVASENTPILGNGQNTGDLVVQVGGQSGTQHDIQITAGVNDTLSTLAQYINNQNWGVTATVLNDATGSRLSVISQNTGATGAMAVENNTTQLTFNTPVGGTDATFTVDGIPYDSTSNTVSGAISGVTLNLLAAIPSVPVQLSVGPDASQAAEAIANFVSAYNAVIGDINTQFTVNPATNSEGPLGGDNSLRLLQSSLLSDTSYTPANGTLFANAVSDPNASILPNGATSGDLQLQIGSSGPSFDVPITAGTNDTLNSLASYINNQNWGLTASVINGASGDRLAITNNSSTIGAVNATSNTTTLSFVPPVVSTFGNLNSLGITMNNDGTLSVDSTQLANALTSDPAGALNFFQNASQTGFANNFASDLQNLTDPTLGLLNIDLSQNQQSQSDIANTIGNLQDRMSAQQTQLINEFSVVNALIEEYPFQLQAIDMQLGIQPNGSSNTAPTAGQSTSLGG